MSSTFDRLLSALDRRIASGVRRARARRGERVHTEELVLRSTAGFKLSAWVHRPAGSTARRLPAVVLCPGIDDPADVFCGWSSPVTADEVARLGCVALRFDPAGRGESWGEEDFGGPEHQDDVATMVRYLAGRQDVDPERIGIVAISLGVAMAVGAAALEGAPVAWVLDWEGPCDREIITAGGSIMAPAAGHSLEDEVYWRPREAVRHVARASCAYVRLQGTADHAQPGETRHATRMMDAAAAPGTRLAWFQLNDHARNAVPMSPIWLLPGQLAANRALLRKIQVLLFERRAA